MSAVEILTTEAHTPKKGAPRGQKRPFRPREVWAIRARLEMLGEVRNLAPVSYTHLTLPTIYSV